MAPNVSDGSIYSYDTKAGLRWGFVIDGPGADGRGRCRGAGASGCVTPSPMPTYATAGATRACTHGLWLTAYSLQLRA